jgi:hypothetical protein
MARRKELSKTRRKGFLKRVPLYILNAWNQCFKTVRNAEKLIKTKQCRIKLKINYLPLK